ncbi:MAG: hypothetical protein O3A00_14175 [Planctomycetota bacterium]|nr:hypothetical protein [Planctomycetota bacterium]
MERKPTPQWPRPGRLEALLEEGRLNPYQGIDEIEAEEGPDWWQYDGEGNPIEEEDDPEDD